MTDKELQDLKSELVGGSCLLVDVREEDELVNGYLKNAILSPLSLMYSGKVSAELAPIDRKIYTYCRSGNRSFMAKSLLESLGFTNVCALKEGFAELVHKGFEIEQK